MARDAHTFAFLKVSATGGPRCENHAFADGHRADSAVEERPSILSEVEFDRGASLVAAIAETKGERTGLGEFQVCPVYSFTEQRPSFSPWAGWIRV